MKSLTTIQFPKFTGVRVLLMPFLMHDLRSLPSYLDDYSESLKSILNHLPNIDGIGYLTIDERLVSADKTHRRPGLHVDGSVNDAIWGQGGGWGKRGFLTAASHVGCRVWTKELTDIPALFGNCEPFRDKFSIKESTMLEPNIVYWLDPLTVHESISIPLQCQRQFIRISLPSNAGWPNSCTPNPTGVQPAGSIIGKRPIRFSNFGN